jgi:dTDP-4-amino-4,6-dideoxygalactose transaminase
MVESVLKSGWVAQGPVVREFEHRLAEYLGVKYAVATSSGSTALDLAMSCIGVGRGDEVIVPDFTFPATANAVVHAGAAPVLTDIEESTFNVDPTQVRRAVSKRTKAIVVVHAFGQPAEMGALMQIARRNQLKIVEDAAGALVSTYHGRKVGTFGDVACFSFDPRKVITTGEGGMLVTNSRVIAELATSLRNHGTVKKRSKTTFMRSGFNYRMSDIQAALGLAQLRRIRFRITEARKLALRYSRLLRRAKSIKCPVQEWGFTHTYQAYCVMLNPEVRDRAIKSLGDRGIETQLGFYALHLQEAFRYYRRFGPLRNSSRAFAGSLVLPMYSGLSEREQHFVVRELIASIEAKDQ